MTADEFDELASRAVRANCSLFSDMESCEADGPAEYAYFLSRYGHGHFGYLLVIEPELLSGPHWSGPFLACAEDESGGYYGFCGTGLSWGIEVFYWYPSEADPPVRSHSSFFDLVAKVGLGPLLNRLQDSGDRP